MGINSENIERLIGIAVDGERDRSFDLVVLGSGMGGMLHEAHLNPLLPLADIRTEGHPMIGGVMSRKERAKIVLAGRVHIYEGADPGSGLLGQFLDAGPERVLLFSAAGGIDPSLSPGDLVLHSDYLSIQPLRRGFPQRNRERTQRYVPPRAMMEELIDAAGEARQKISLGVYSWVSGPSYETRAEIRMLRLAGASLVGMSIYHEVADVVSRGIPVLSLSLVTNRLSDTGRVVLDHGEVTAASARGLGSIRRLVECW